MRLGEAPFKFVQLRRRETSTVTLLFDRLLQVLTAVSATTRTASSPSSSTASCTSTTTCGRAVHRRLILFWTTAVDPGRFQLVVLFACILELIWRKEVMAWITDTWNSREEFTQHCGGDIMPLGGMVIERNTAHIYNTKKGEI